MGASRFSQDPVDRLIRELIHTGRGPAPEESEQIVRRIAAAPFNPAVVPVRMEHRGLTYLGRTLGAREDSLAYHLVLRVVVERQWAPGTTASQYIADLATAATAPAARLGIYRRRGGHVAVTVTPTGNVLGPGRRGARALANLIVVYTADRSMIVTGYQVTRLSGTGIPDDVRWLK